MRKEKAKRLGVIDLGTNSVRFDVHEALDGQTRLLHREKLMVRLGENVFLTGKLDPKAFTRTFQALRSFKHRAEELQVDRLAVFGTSALREAMDSSRLIRKIEKDLGLTVHVISGQEEAALIAEGILAREKTPKGPFALVDIGGGSTEISVCRGTKVQAAESFPLGVARLQQLFLRSIPPAEGKQAVKHLRGHIRDILEPWLRHLPEAAAHHVIGSSGTMRALSRMAKRNTGKDITRKWLQELIETLLPLDIDQIRALPGMDPKRADLVLAGTIVIHEILRALGADTASATEFSLRDGILDQQLQLLKPVQPNSRGDLESFLEKARHFGQDLSRLRWLVTASQRLFRRLQKVHRLDSEWFTYLAVAALFRKAGRLISPVEFETHSAYIVRHASAFSELWETELVAQLCLLHAQSKASLEKIAFHGPAQYNGPFLKLLSLLRLIDALDSAEPKRVEAERVDIQKGRVCLWLSKSDSTELALLRLEQKKALFEKVFGKYLSVRQIGG